MKTDMHVGRSEVITLYSWEFNEKNQNGYHVFLKVLNVTITGLRSNVKKKIL